MVAISENAGRLLFALRAKDVKLARVGDKLRWSAPMGVLNPAWHSLLADYRDELLELLDLEDILRSEKAQRDEAQ